MEKEVGRLENGSHLWVVKEYGRHKRHLGVGKSIESNDFTAGGHRWAIVFFPKGRSVDNGYASVYLTLKTKTEGNSPLQFLYEIYVVNGKDEGVGFSLYKDYLSIPCLRAGEFSGWACFMKQEALESLDYLRDDDCLRIGCTVGVLTCPFLYHPRLSFTPAFMYYDYDIYLKQICSFWFQKLVAYLKTPSTAARGRLQELKKYSKFFSFAKRSFVGKGYQKLQKKED